MGNSTNTPVIKVKLLYISASVSLLHTVPEGRSLGEAGGGPRMEEEEEEEREEEDAAAFPR